MVGLEVSSRRLCADILNSRLTTRVLEHLQGSPQGKALSEFIKFDSARHEGQTQQQHQQIAH
jgi:hypothetical protein